MFLEEHLHTLCFWRRFFNNNKAFDSIYSNLYVLGNYNINVTDVNGCSVDGSSPTSTTVNGFN